MRIEWVSEWVSDRVPFECLQKPMAWLRHPWAKNDVFYSDVIRLQSQRSEVLRIVIYTRLKIPWAPESFLARFPVIATRAKSFAARGFGLRPKRCRPSANTENSRRRREKPLVPRVGWRKIENKSLYKFPAPKHVSFRKYSILSFRVFTVRDTKIGMLSHWKESLLLIFRSLTISSIKRCVYAHVC